MNLGQIQVDYSGRKYFRAAIVVTHSSSGSKIVAQQSNIALVAALLLTIQFSFAYTLPSIWDPMVNADDSSASYLLSCMTPDQVQIVHEVPMCAPLSSKAR